ncbi:phage GP46 family protein [Neisseria sp. Ec49-e6-T10]|uniref:phage GP46 family protein n=1 Tax=Neisseria sp. Ec49-e6-T10 TaxID=3140744 RepID=UPI003EC1283A
MDNLLDPYTGDYVLNEHTTSLHNAAYIRLQEHLGAYWAAPNVGSKLHTLQREKDKIRVHKLAVQYAEQALQPLIDDKRASKLEVYSNKTQNPDDKTQPKGWVVLTINLWDAGGEQVSFDYHVRVR